MSRKLTIVTAFLTLLGSICLLNGQTAPATERKILLQKDLAVPGYETILASVTLPVGSREGRHTHSGNVLLYVESGELTLDYEGKPTTTYKAGEYFFIEPGKIHEGMNKGTVPVRAIATYIIEKGKPIATPVAK